MQLYTSQPGLILGRHIYAAEQVAEMVVENYKVRKGRHGGDTLTFNGYGSDETHSARRPNTRDPWVRSNYYAATWDQWGVFLSVLFAHDPAMRVGGYKRPYYTGSADFHFQTDGRFNQDMVLSHMREAGLFHGDHRFGFDPSLGGMSVHVSRCTKTLDDSTQCTARLVRR